MQNAEFRWTGLLEVVCSCPLLVASIRVGSGCSISIFECLQRTEGPITSLGSLSQCLTILVVKNIFVVLKELIYLTIYLADLKLYISDFSILKVLVSIIRFCLLLGKPDGSSRRVAQQRLFGVEDCRGI